MGIEASEIGELLKSVGAWQMGHFLLSSGLHSDQYIQCQRVLQFPRHGLALARALVEKVLNAGLRPQAVVGPALGAVHWELLVAQAFDQGLAAEPVRGVFAERPERSSDFAIRRGIELSAGERIIVVEDVTTTGGSARRVVELVRELGAEPIAVGAIVDRSAGAAAFGCPFFPLIELSLETYQPDHCPMCKQGQLLVKPGSSREIGA